MTAEDVGHLVRSRPSQAREALEDARALLDAGRGGRSAVNRAYYAAFYGVMALLQTKGKVPRKHQGAISLFDREFVHGGLFPTEVSADLHRLFEARQEDDYLRLDPIPLEEARHALEISVRFLAAVERHLKSAGFDTGA